MAGDFIIFRPTAVHPGHHGIFIKFSNRNTSLTEIEYLAKDLRCIKL